jgi:hypothetical protein
VIVVVAGPVVICALAWVLARALRAVRHTPGRSDHGLTPGEGRRDLPAAIVAFSAHRLRGERGEWADAMVAELDALAGRLERWTFALGSVRVAIAPPLLEARPATVQRVMIAIGALGIVGVATYGQIRMAANASTGGHGLIGKAIGAVVIVVVLGAESAMASRRARAADSAAHVARRWGVPGGAVMGASLIVTQTPIFAGSDLRTPTIALLVALVTPLVVGALAARASHDRRAGRAAAAWTGAIGGFVFFVGFMTLTFSATAWFTHDPSTIRAYQDSLSPAHFASYGSHYRSITGFVMSENSDTALLGGLLWLPVVAAIAGRLGARCGYADPSARTGR